MNTPLYPLSERELDRADIIQRFIRHEITRHHAAALLDCTERHVARLARAIERHGSQALAHQSRGRPSNHASSPEEREIIAGFITTNYSDFGPRPWPPSTFTTTTALPGTPRPSGRS